MALAQIDSGYANGYTPTYDELVSAYEQLDQQYENAALLELGSTDSGRKLHLFLISSTSLEGDNSLATLVKQKAVVLVMNGIHPGESCGIDASLLFANEMLANDKVADDVIFAIIPVYNVGGMLNRGAYSRANQDGPHEHGFRGNARDLDLNRDFVKADALNTTSFYAVFQALQPHIFIDTHTSNGADYQYTMTLISTQKDKLNPILSKVLQDDLEPYLYKKMEKEGWPMTPYVNVFGYTPDEGYAAFLETPRYASGYTAAFNTIGFITETHMLKTYKDRVESTLSFLQVMNEYVGKNAKQLISAREKAFEYDMASKNFDVSWKLDSTQVVERKFKGYGYSYPESEISGGKRLKYQRSEPKEYTIDYYDTYVAIDNIQLPEYYVVPQAWREVVLRLQYNNVQMYPFLEDTTIEVTSTYIVDPEFLHYPYEGHFYLKNLKTEKQTQQRLFLKGDFLVKANQRNARFIASVLEPTAVDSYLRWNFFDEIFQQKEYFSPYVFEETAERLLEEDSELRTAFESWKAENPEKASNNYAALTFIYKRSAYYEKEHLRYPVARIE